MIYKKTLRFDSFTISFSTNSKTFHREVCHLMDPETGKPKRQTQGGFKLHINVRVDPVKNRKTAAPRKYIYRKSYQSPDTILMTLEQPATSVQIDLKRGCVEAEVHALSEAEKERIIDFVIIHPLRLFLANQGSYFYHASFVHNKTHGVLFVGKSGSGKSTLGLQLAKEGFSFLADDACFIRASGKQHQINPFPTKIGVQQHVLKKNKAWLSGMEKQFEYGNKKRISRHRLGRARLNPARLKLGMIVFPAYKAGKKLQLTRLSPEKCAERLWHGHRTLYHFEGERNGKRLAEAFFWSCVYLSKQVPAYILHYENKTIPNLGKVIQPCLLKSKTTR